MTLRTIGRALIVSGLLAAAAPVFASHLIPRTLPELASGAEVMFVGQCESVSCHWNADHSLILTASRFRVERALKGAPGDSFTLEELGGTVGDRSLQVSDIPRYRVGEEVLLCAHRTVLGRWETFGAGQGKFRIARDAQGRLWVQSSFYQRELAAMAPAGRGLRGAPLSALAGHLLSASRGNQ